ncbi:MAG: TraM recognition domain-containing protein [Saccharothrix sp.]|nr:TraM recognition domain-containing protein [Saccharothrix sp.]
MDLVSDTGVPDDVLTALEFGGGAVLAAAVGRAWYRHSERAERAGWLHTDGWVGWSDLRNFVGLRAALRVADQVRPGLAKDRRGDYKPKPTDYAMALGTIAAGHRPVRGRGAYLSYEQCVLVIGPPRSGKTMWMIPRILEAPGGVLTASTKTDVYQATHRLRRRRGPVWVFNPQLLGTIGSTFGWSPVQGCHDHRVATERARALVGGTKAVAGISEESWGEKVSEVLRALLMAAAIGGYDMATVARWVENPDDQTPLLILEGAPHLAPPGWASGLRANLENRADKMRASIWNLLLSVVAFMSNPTVAAACNPHPDQQFSIEELVYGRGTLYLIGDDRDETIAPLLAALTEYIHGEAERLAAADGGRLDPPFGLILDEAARIVPVPLHSWGATSGGVGMYLVALVQTPDQIRERWGEHNSATIWSVFGTKLILGGLSNGRDLEEISKIVGERDVNAVAEGQSEVRGPRGRHWWKRFARRGSVSRTRTVRTERVLTPAQVRLIPRQHALVLTSAARATVITYPNGYQQAAERLAAEEKAELKARARAAGGRVPDPAGPGPVTPMPQEIR